jgi:DNA replication protein DnaC
MTAATALDLATLQEYCRVLRLATVAAPCERLAQDARRQQQSPLAYLASLLAAEVDERERRAIARRLQEAHVPRLKTWEDFDFSAAPQVSAARLQQLAEGHYLDRAEPIIFIGDSGTGKTHLATGLCVVACRQQKRARFITAAGLVNELVEAQQQHLLGRALQRWTRLDLIVLDEVGYVPFAQGGAELLLQVISERAERTAWIITTNLPFSEWTQVFLNARLCKALLDRITDRAHIIETGTDSYRFKRTLTSRKQLPESRAHHPSQGT